MSRALHRITYVEDEPDIRAIAELMLTTVGGFETDMCASGQEALDRTAAFNPDLILLDVMMPGLDGPQTLAGLRKDARLARTPVIFVTAKVQGREVSRYISMGAVDVIPKPFDPLTLPDRLRSIFDRATAAPEGGGEAAAERVLALVEQHCRSLVRQSEHLRDLVDRYAMQDGPGGDAAGIAGDVAAIAHSLTGSAGAFGFSEISEAARGLEVEADRLMRPDGAPHGGSGGAVAAGAGPGSGPGSGEGLRAAYDRLAGLIATVTPTQSRLYRARLTKGEHATRHDA